MDPVFENCSHSSVWFFLPKVSLFMFSSDNSGLEIAFPGIVRKKRK